MGGTKLNGKDARKAWGWAAVEVVRLLCQAAFDLARAFYWAMMAFALAMGIMEHNLAILLKAIEIAAVVALVAAAALLTLIGWLVGVVPS